MGGPAEHEQKIVSALLEARTDEALWAVYADLLMEREDRRADLILCERAFEKDPASSEEHNTLRMQIMKRMANDWFPPLAEVHPRLQVTPHGIWARYAFGASTRREYIRFQVDVKRGHIDRIWAELYDPESIPMPAFLGALIHLMDQPEAVLLRNLQINTADSARKGGRILRPTALDPSFEASLWERLFAAWSERTLPVVYLSLSDARGAVSRKRTEFAHLWKMTPYLETLRLGLRGSKIGWIDSPKLRSVSLVGSEYLQENLEALVEAKLKHLAVRKGHESYVPKMLAPVLQQPQPNLVMMELSGFVELGALMEALLASRLWPQLQSLNLMSQASPDAQEILAGHRKALSKLKRFVPPWGTEWGE